MSRTDDPILNDVFGHLAPVLRDQIRLAYDRGYADGRASVAVAVEGSRRESDGSALTESWMPSLVQRRGLTWILAVCSVVVIVIVVAGSL